MLDIQIVRKSVLQLHCLRSVLLTRQAHIQVMMNIQIVRSHYSSFTAWGVCSYHDRLTYRYNVGYSDSQEVSTPASLLEECALNATGSHTGNDEYSDSRKSLLQLHCLRSVLLTRQAHIQVVINIQLVRKSLLQLHCLRSVLLTRQAHIQVMMNIQIVRKSLLQLHCLPSVLLTRQTHIQVMMNIQIVRKSLLQLHCLGSVLLTWQAHIQVNVDLLRSLYCWNYQRVLLYDSTVSALKEIRICLQEIISSLR